jgi:thioredoxin 1
MITTHKKAVRVTDTSFDREVLQSKELVMVDFGADWCPPCNAISPIVEILATEFAGKAKIAKLDIDDNREMTSRFKIRNLPTLLFFKDGKPVDKIVGAVGKKAITEKLNQYL